MQPTLRLLKTPTITLGNESYDLLPHKPVCLLVYLAYQGTWISREVLASLFWPEDDEASARHNLRMLLSRAKQLPWAKDLESETTRLRWQISTDVKAFREAVGKSNWEQVATLHCTPLLASWRLNDMPGLEEWLELERESLLGSWREGVLKHSRTLSQTMQYAQATDFLKTLLLHDPLAEDVLALYLENAYLSGQRDEALKAYETFKHLLAKELDLEPLQETQDLVETIRQTDRVKPRTTTQEDQNKASIPLTLLRPPKLIGRELEQQQLETSTTQVVLISGESGVGKSRFLSDSLTKPRWLRCREGLGNVAYFPLVDYLRNNLNQLPDIGPYLLDLARLVPEVSPQASYTPDPQTAKVRLSEALALALEDPLALESPLSLEIQSGPIIFEDLQWADTATLEFLVFLSVRSKIKIYGSYRSNEVTEALASTLKSLRSSHLLSEIKLEALSKERVQDMLASLIGLSKGPQKFSAWLANHSGGNPFFALETLKNLFERKFLQSKDGNWHSELDDITQDYSELDVPTSINEVIERRLSRLAEVTQRVLQAASVIGQGFTPKVLAQVVGLSEWGVVEALEQSETSNLTQGGSFQHDLLRQSIYSGLPSVRRKLLHSQVASAITNTADALIVAEHYKQADELDQAIPFYRQASQNYVAKGLHNDAKDLLENILDLTQGQTRLELQTHLANICVELGVHSKAEDILATLSSEVLPPQLYKETLFTKAALLFHQGQLAHVADIAAELSELSPDPYRLSALRSQVAFYQNQFAEVKTILTPLLEQLRRKNPSPELVKTLTDFGVACDELGEHQTGTKHLKEAMRVAKAIGARHLQVVIANNLLWGAVTSGNVKPILPEAEEALSLGEYAATMTLRNNLARAYFSLGQDAKAKYHYETITTTSQDPTLLCIAWARLAELYQRNQDSKATYKALEQALSLLNQTEFSVAHLSVGTTVAKFGTDIHLRQVMPFIKEYLETEAGQEIQGLLKNREKEKGERGKKNASGL